MTQLSRRSLLGIGACLIAAPAIVRASSLMEVRAITHEGWITYLDYLAQFSPPFARRVRLVSRDREEIGRRFPTGWSPLDVYRIRFQGDAPHGFMTSLTHPLPAPPSLGVVKSSAPTSFDALRTITLPEVIA